MKSRMELGTAAQTKKPTSVVLMNKPSDEKLVEKYESLFNKLKEANPFT